jgi:hypothetical membrane protein
MNDETLEQLAKLGYVAPAISVGFVFLATLIDPKFSWRTRSLSSIGEATNQSLFALGTADQIAFVLFNSGLFLSALLGLPFAYVLWVDAKRRFERAGVVLLVVSLLGNMGVGIAYLDGPYAALHFPMALTLFVGIAFTLWAHGSGLVQRTRGRAGLLAIWIANVYVIGWVVWMVLEALVFTSDGDTWTYFAVPEFVGAIALGVWVVLQARRILSNPA